MGRVVEKLLKLLPPSLPVLRTRRGMNPLKITGVAMAFEPSQLRIFKVDAKLRSFPPLTAKYLQYILQPTACDRTMAEKEVPLDLLDCPMGLPRLPPGLRPPSPQAVSFPI